MTETTDYTEIAATGTDHDDAPRRRGEDAVLYCIASESRDQFWDITLSTGAIYRTVQCYVFAGLIVMTQRDNDFPTMLAPAHVVSLAISAQTWGHPATGSALNLA